jgi:hypothetical protein
VLLGSGSLAPHRIRIARSPPRLSINAALTAGAFAVIAALLGMMAAISSRSAIAVISVAAIMALLGLLAFGALMVASWRERAR